MKIFKILAFLLLIVSYPTLATEYPKVLQLNNIILCDTKDQAVEILDTYQSSGIDSAIKIFDRLTNEKNKDGDRKCGIGGGTYLFIQEAYKVKIEEKTRDLLGLVLHLFDVMLKQELHVLIIIPYNSSTPVEKHGNL